MCNSICFLCTLCQLLAITDHFWYLLSISVIFTNAKIYSKPSKIYDEIEITSKVFEKESSSATYEDNLKNNSDCDKYEEMHFLS